MNTDWSFWLNAWWWSACNAGVLLALLWFGNRCLPRWFSASGVCWGYALVMVRMWLPLPAPWQVEIPGAGWILLLLATVAAVRMAVVCYRSGVLYRNILREERWLAERTHRIFLAERQAMRLTARPTLICSSIALSPMLIGWLRPLLFLPAAWAEQCRNDSLELVCRHELKHLQLHDLWLIWGWELVRSWYWFVPGMRQFSDDFRLQREFRCDAAVVAESRVAAEHYSAALLELAAAPAELVRHFRGAAALAEHTSEVRQRVARLLAPGGRRYGAVGVAVVAALLLGGVGLSLRSARTPVSPTALLERAIARIDVAGQLAAGASLQLTATVLVGEQSLPCLYYDDGERAALVIPQFGFRAVDLPQGRWTIANRTGEPVELSEELLGEELNVRAKLQAVILRYDWKMETLDGQWILTGMRPGQRPVKIVLSPAGDLQEMTSGATSLHFSEYRNFDGVHYPTRVVREVASTDWPVIVYQIGEVTVGGKAQESWFEPPQITTLRSPLQQLGDWHEYGLSNSIPKAERIARYGELPEYCEQIRLENWRTGAVTMVTQLRFAAPEQSAAYLQSPPEAAADLRRWAVDSYVLEASPRSADEEWLIRQLQEKNLLLGRHFRPSAVAAPLE